MAQGRVQVNNLNLAQGETLEIERKLLFMGSAQEHTGDILTLNSQTDIDDLFPSESPLKLALIAAQLNAGQNWFAWVLPMPASATRDDYLSAFDLAMETNLKATSPEGFVIVDEAAETKDVTVWYDKTIEVLGKMGRQLFGIVALPGIDRANETWSVGV